MSAALIVLDGVLRAQSGAAILDGVDLYRSLMASHDVVVLSDVSKEDATRWLRREKLVLPPYLLGDDLPRAEQLSVCRSGLGLPVALCITSSPAEVTLALREGITGVLFAHPLFQRPEFRPDHVSGRRPWAELTGEIAHQASLLDDVGADQ